MLALFVYHATPTEKKEIKKFIELNVEKGSWETMATSTKPSQAETNKMQVTFAKRGHLHVQRGGMFSNLVLDP